MNLGQFWYVLADSKHLKADQVLHRVVNGEWIALFRDVSGKPVAILDRCLHRGTQLSLGKVKNGCLQCPYHGWVYNEMGKVVEVRSEGPGPSKFNRPPQKTFQTAEQDSFIYVRLDSTGDTSIQPFKMPHHGEKGWSTIRYMHKFKNNVVNCAENFLDIPHTVFVHPNIFRQKNQYEKFGAEVHRLNGSVITKYKNETNNFGIFSKFLNSKKKEIHHVDSFHMPNITCVEYIFGPKRVFYITSQCVPVSDTETWVYTDLTYNYGFWNWFAWPIIWLQGKMIIGQDVKILGNQSRTNEKYGTRFMSSQADTIHLMIESVRDELEEGRDPRLLPEKKINIEFWV